jgi:negative regulator of flagellin synthesis FlgM
MKISTEEVSRILQAQGLRPAKTNGTNGNGKAAGNSSATPATSVELSGRAKEIQQVRKLVENAPDVREDLVNALKAQIESGEYKVSGEEVADLMIRRALADGVR